MLVPLGVLSCCTQDLQKRVLVATSRLSLPLHTTIMEERLSLAVESLNLEVEAKYFWNQGLRKLTGVGTLL